MRAYDQVGTFLAQHGEHWRVPVARIDCLTEREKAVVRLLRAEKTYKEIGLELGISENTVRSHVVRIYSKLGIHNRYRLPRA